MIQKIIKSAADLLLASNGIQKYEEINEYFGYNTDKSELEIAAYIAAGTVITYRIPLKYINGQPIFRDLTACLNSYNVFRNTHNEEVKLKTLSESPGFDFFKKYGNIKIGKLSFTDSSHDTFHSGPGTDAPDFVDEFGNKIEVKHKALVYGSPSGLHKSTTLLLDCDDYTSYLYEVANRRLINPSVFIAFYDRLLPPRNTRVELNVCAEILKILESGELIPAIEELYLQNGGTWNLM
jgi:hypothetical protein